MKFTEEIHVKVSKVQDLDDGASSCSFSNCFYQNAASMYLSSKNEDFKTVLELVFPVPDGSRLGMRLALRKLPNGWYEAFTPYGYGGIRNSNSFQIDYEQLVRKLHNLKICNVFVRHCPILKSQLFFPAELRHYERKTFSVSLIEQSWSSYLAALDKKLRWSIKFAEKKGLDYEFVDGNHITSEKIAVIFEIYSMAMVQKFASKQLQFNLSYFNDLFTQLGARLIVTLIKKENSIVYFGIFAKDLDTSVQYLFSAGVPKVRGLQAGELMLSRSINFLSTCGYNTLHLGGGLTDLKEDGLARFKKKFSTSEHDFVTSRLVINKVKYDNLSGEYGENKNIFLIGDRLRWFE